MSIAVLHHMSTPERRLQALRELFRILRRHREGKLLLYVRSHERQDLIVKGAKLLNGYYPQVIVSVLQCPSPVGAHAGKY